MSHDVGMLRAKLRQALDRIGNHNGHAPPDTGSNADPALHELYVADEMLAYAKTRRDDALDKCMHMAYSPDELDEIVTRVTKSLRGEDLVALDGFAYQMTLSLSKPAKRLDQTALRNLLQTKHGMSAEQVSKLFDEASKYSSPAKRVKVMAR